MRKTTFGLVAIVALVGAFFMTLSPHAQGTVVEMGGTGFAPATVHLAHPGRALTFVNHSRGTHTATCLGCPLDSGDVQPGEDRTVTFPSAGTYVLADRYGPGSITVVVGSATSPSPAAS